MVILCNSDVMLDVVNKHYFLCIKRPLTSLEMPYLNTLIAAQQHTMIFVNK